MMIPFNFIGIQKRTAFSQKFCLLTACLIVSAGCNKAIFVSKLQEEKIRVLNVDTASNQFIPNVKLSMTIDNSFSMDSKQAILAANSGSLADALRGRNVDVHVHSTSSLDSATLAQKRTHDPLTFFTYPDSSGDLISSLDEPTSSQGSAIPAYTRVVQNQLRPSLGTSVISFTAAMSDAEFEVQKALLQATITGIGVSGSDTEAGICAASRVLEENGASRFFDQGDKAAFLFLSDSNDFSVSSQCRRETSRENFQFVTNPGQQVVVNDNTNPQWWQYAAQFKNPDAHRLNYTYNSGSNYTLKVGYTQYRVFSTHSDPNNYKVTANYNRPRYQVVANYNNPQWKVNYTYSFTGTCFQDQIPIPCPQQQVVTNVSFNPAQVGNPPAANGNCPTGLRDWVIANQLQAGQTLVNNSCTYTYNANAGSQTQDFVASDYGIGTTPSTPQACTANLNNFALQNLVPSGSTMTGCTWNYSLQTGSSAPTAFSPTNPAYGNPPSGSGLLACTPGLISYAQSLVPSGWTYTGCSYTAPRTTSSGTRFLPQNYGNPAGTPLNQNLPCNAQLTAYAQTSPITPTGRIFVSCHYQVSNSTQNTNNINPANYGNPPTGTGNLPCNAELATLAAQPSSIPVNTIYNNICNYSTTTVTENGFVALASDPILANGANCLTIPALLEQVQAAQPSQTITACTYERVVGSTVGNCSYTDGANNLSLNLCSGSAFTVSGAEQANFETYLRANPSLCGDADLNGKEYTGCARVGKRNEISGASQSYVSTGAAVSKTVVAAMSEGLLNPVPTDFGPAFHAKAVQLFGAADYYMAGILSKVVSNSAAVPGNCEPSPDASAAGSARYWDLIQSRPAYLRNTLGYCASSYQPALDGIAAFIISTSINSYQIPIELGEEIITLTRSRSGALVVATKNVDYIQVGQRIDFTPGFIEPGDSFSVVLRKEVFVRDGTNVVAPTPFPTASP